MKRALDRNGDGNESRVRRNDGIATQKDDNVMKTKGVRVGENSKRRAGEMVAVKKAKTEESAMDDKKQGKGSNSSKIGSRSIQSTFTMSDSTQSTTCKMCGMCYYNQLEKDRSMHSKYHFNFENGVNWPIKNAIRHTFSVNNPKAVVEIVSVDRDSPRQVLKAGELLDMVNKELSAPDGAAFWKEHTKESLIQGQAFVAVVDNRAIGICVIDPIIDTDKQCKWMIYRTQKIVPNQVNKQIKVGVSRIWIAPKWRRKGIAAELLQCVTSSMVYGMILRKEEIGFSQPSFGGGLLAKSFNGAKHKSGETLIPVYIEENSDSSVP